MKPLLVKFGIWKQSLGALAVLVALGVSTTLLGAPSVTLAWNPNSDPAVSGYKVSYGEASGNYTQALDLGNATNATVSALVQGHTYYFAVSAYNASALESDFSNEVKYTVPVGNSPPTANDISLATAEDTPTNMVLSGGDPDGDPLTYTVVKNPRHGTLGGQSPRLVYTPQANYLGTDSFTFRVNDGSLSSSLATVSITVSAIAGEMLAIASPTVTDIGLRLAWNSIAGKTYRVLYKDDLSSATWAAAGDDLLAGGSSMSWVDATTGAQVRRFYRVELVNP